MGFDADRTNFGLVRITDTFDAINLLPLLGQAQTARCCQDIFAAAVTLFTQTVSLRTVVIPLCW